MNPICKVSCPTDLGELEDDTFGATSRKLLEVIGILRECTAACTTEDPETEEK